MEDGEEKNATVISKINEQINNEQNDDVSLLPNMANYPDIEITVIKNKSTAQTDPNPNTTTTTTNTSKINGESDNSDNNKKDEEEKTESSTEKEDSTDEDALVIDEEYKSRKRAPVKRKRLLSPISPKGNFKGFKKRMLRRSTEMLKNVNDLIDNVTGNQDNCDIKKKLSEGELINVNSVKELPLSPNKNVEEHIKVPDCVEILNSNKLNNDNNINLTKTTVTNNKSNNKKNPKLSPKLTEYAQYLGLQPTVKFKCYKCSESSFPSMIVLNEHQQKCLAEPSKENQVINPNTNPTSTNFRVTRKVFLCSACGTYYENWNLFLHMREVHRRFICLYCLGMFSLVEKLTQHLITKHNCSPTSYLTAEEYLNSCKDSSFLMCCHCEKIFTEQENFFEHICCERTTYTEKNCWSCGVKGTNPHLITCKASIEQPKSKKRTGTNEELLSSNLIEPEFYTEPCTSTTKLKIKNKKTIKKPIPAIEHVTADSHSNSKNNEKNCDITNLCTVNMETIKTEPESPAKSPHDDPDPNNDNSSKPNDNPETDPTDMKNPSEFFTTEQTNLNHTEENQTVEKMDMKTEEQNEENQSLIENNTEPSFNEKFDESAEEMPKDDSFEENCQKSVSAETSYEDPKINNETSLDSIESFDDSDKNIVTSDTSKMEVEPIVNNSSPKEEKQEPETEKRCVPKITLKLPPNSIRTHFSDHDSDNSDSDKLTMEVDENDDYSDHDHDHENEADQPDPEEDEESHQKVNVNGGDCDLDESHEDFELEHDLQIAGEDIPVNELELDKPLDKFDMEDLIKTCLNATIQSCLYCNHARKIAVCGKGLALHAISEHRFSATVNSITAEELIPNSFVVRIKRGLKDVEDKFFNLEPPREESTIDLHHFKREYECFQCRYVTTIHKELYLHNRKMHAKTILLCIMCKSNFYSYSELICHLCPGMYVLNSEMKFRCCMCDIPDLPSAFRLMVHLRKKHHTCDVCLEGCQNQSRLSNHVWKHKLHHLCYRCGIAYRNKPDITKHLFWKHGTESVLCKKCLQKKWPHVYHFCIPPTAFICEECNLTFSKAVYLKVHKRLHTNDKKHSCTEENCTESFISKKLLLKHERRHRDPSPIPEKPLEIVNGDETLENEKVESLEKESTEEPEVKMETQEPDEKEKLIEEEKEKEDNKKNLIDAFDLPALNLSESDSSDSEDEKPKPKVENQDEVSKPLESIDVGVQPQPDIEPLQSNTEIAEVEEQKLEVVDGIWDNFKQYQATIEKRDSFHIDRDEDKPKDEVVVEKEDTLIEDSVKVEMKEPLSEVQQEILPDLEVIMVDHDYCATTTTTTQSQNKDCSETVKTEEPTENRKSEDNTETKPEIKPDQKSKTVSEEKEKKKSSSSSDSSDSDSSSCTCGSNCSCSSSSGSSSSSSSSSDSDSSSSEGKKRIAARRERRKERAKRKKSETSQAASNNSIDIMPSEETKPPIIEIPIQESDLETTETETDEDFYDEYPQRLANKLLEEKRNQLLLLAGVAPPMTNGSIVENSRPSTPSIPEEAQQQQQQNEQLPTVTKQKKSKSKKRKKKSRNIATPKREMQIIPYQNHQPPIVPQVNPVLPLPQIVQLPQVIQKNVEAPKLSAGSGSETDSNIRMSKRRRVPNKFYGYSSDEENAEKPPAPPILKWRKADLPTPQPKIELPKTVPPITIKNIPSPAPIIEPKSNITPIVHHMKDSDSETEMRKKSSSESSDSNQNDDSDSDTGQLHITHPPVVPNLPMQISTQFPPQRNENLYCYCQCPYDEVSEMIACDGRDCAIEWFHFECVGIMVPPKGKWYCPDCRKKANMKSDYIQT